MTPPPQKKDVHILIPRTCEYVTWQRDFADVIQFRILRWETILGYWGGPDVIITRFLIRRGQEVRERRR